LQIQKSFGYKNFNNINYAYVLRDYYNYTQNNDLLDQSLQFIAERSDALFDDHLNYVIRLSGDAQNYKKLLYHVLNFMRSSKGEEIFLQLKESYDDSLAKIHINFYRLLLKLRNV